MATASTVPAGTVWSTALLELLGAPQTPANYQFLNQWLLREHSAGDLYGAQYGNNPFFTTAGAGGTVGSLKAGTYPTVPSNVSPAAHNAGVAMYPNETVGVFANAMHIGLEYPTIAAALKSGTPASFANNANFQRELSRWSGGGYSDFQSIAAPAAPVGATLPASIKRGADGFIAIGPGGTPINPSPTGPSAIPGAGAVKGAVSSAEAVGSFLGKVTSTNFIVRSLQIVAGAALVGAGVMILAKQVGLADSAPTLPVPVPV